MRGHITAQRIALDGSTGADGAARPFDDWLAAEGARPEAVQIQPEWAFNIIYSSGTTGTPKGVVQPHAHALGPCAARRPYGYGPDAVTLLATPLYSNTTLVVSFRRSAWAARPF